MKKALMLVAAVALLAAPVFAEVEVAISGEATTTLGFDLDNQYFGLDSDVSANVTLNIGSLDGESMGEGNWYGVISLDGAALSWDSDGEGDKLDIGIEYSGTDANGDDIDDGTLVLSDTATDTDSADETLYVQTPYSITAPDVTAKITNGNIYIQLQSEAGLDADFVSGVTDGTDADDFDVDYGQEGSLTFGGVFGPLTAALEVATAGDSDAAGYGVALEADLTVAAGPVTIDADYVAGFGMDSSAMAFGVQATAAVSPITAVVAFDGIYDAGFDWELGADIDLALDPLTVGVEYYYGNAMDVALAVGFAKDSLTADVTFGLYDLTGTLGWAAALDLTFAVNSGISLAAGYSVDSDIVMAAYFNATFTELVDNVTFVAGWQDGDDLTNGNLGEIIVSAGLSY